MKAFSLQRIVITITAFILFSFVPAHKKAGWISLFDGTSVNGWKVGNNASTFSIENGAIRVNGEVAHLFYDGEVMQHHFKNFELKIDVMTTPGFNSGVYFHTQYQQSGWPQSNSGAQYPSILDRKSVV